MNNSLARKFTFTSLIKFSIPTIIMMIFMSLYTMVDGVFVSRLVGTNALSAVNIVFPLVSIVIAIGIMLATGSSAVIAKKMGEGNYKQARENFSLVSVVSLAIGVIFTILGLIFINPLIRLLGASDAIFNLCYEYTYMLLFFIPFSILAMLFQTLFVTAGKPVIGLVSTILGGIANIVLDYVFISPMNMGIAGAALATGIGYSIPSLIGLLYFFINRKNALHFVKPKFDFKFLLKSCTNGSSEMVTNLSTAVTTFLFNIIMMNYMGEDGVAAITIILYVQYLLTAVYLGYSTGIAPILSFKYGHKDTPQIKRIFNISIKFILACSVISLLISYLLAKPIVSIFSPEGSTVFNITVNGFHLFAISFLFTGINIFASALFTAFSDGKTSAIISFLRTFVFIVLMLILLPMIININGVWLAVPVAEALGIVVSIIYLYKKRHKYNYA